MSTTSSKMMAYDTAKKSFDFVKCENGVLTVSNSGGGGGDASSANQLTQITEAQTTNSKLTTINSNILIVKTDLQASLIVQEAINQKIDTRVVKCDTDNVIIDSFTPVNTLLLAKVENTLNNAFLTLDDAQNLKVSVSNQNDISTLSTEAKQDLQIIEAELSNTKLETINTTLGSLATSAIQQSSNTAIWNKLGLIEQGTTQSSQYLQTIDTNLTPLQQGIARYDLNAITTLAPDTVPAYSAPVSGIPASEGWYYKNTGAGNASQLYYYANQSSQTRNRDYTISAIESQWAVVRILNLNSGTSLPFLVVYSQPQGTGDIIPGFARSSWVYQVSTGQDLRLGEKIIIYRGAEPDSRIFPELRRVECTLSVTRGPALTSELLAYATVNTDSGAPVNTVEYVIGGAGLSMTGDHVYKVELTAETQAISGGDASSANQVSSNTAICTRLDNSIGELSNIKVLLADSINVVNYGLLNDTPQYVPIRASSTGNLYVSDISATSNIILLKSEIETINGVLSDLITGDSQMYVRLDGTDDSVQILATDIMTQAPSALLSENGKLLVQGDFYQATQPVEFTSAQDVNLYAGAGLTHTETASGQFSLDVKVNNSTDIPVSGLFFQETQPVSIDRLGFTAEDELIVYDGDTFQELQTLNGKVVLCDTGNVVISGTVPISSASALSVTESNPITGFALETTLDDVKTQTDKLNFFTLESVNNLNVIDTALNAQLGQFSFFTGEDMITDLRVRVMNTNLDIGNFPETQPVSIASTIDTNITNTSLDVHCFGSNDGTTFHHLKTTNQGVLITHSETRDGTGNLITSTAVSGTEVYTALDVVCRGITSISGIVKTQSQDSNNTQIANNVSVTGPSRVGNADADTQGYLWVSAIFQFSSVTTGGQVYLEVSHDANIWARPSSASVFVMTSMAQTSGSIILSTPIPFRYVRLWADTGFVGLGCSAWIVMK